MKKTVFFIFTMALFAGNYKIDSESKLIVDKGLEDVKENCVVCHTGRFIVKNGGDKKFWETKIRVMQKAFGLWDLDKRTHDSIVNYLAKNYHKDWKKGRDSLSKDLSTPKLNLK